ncbi:MAG: pantoate--beta-alanine ligase, partial [Actinomycetia bacterium]|nr:pantoate--beta-alanine ligase [Actinomycetes bacterium]
KKTAHNIAEIKKALESSDGRTVGLVPTMGALHRGHLSLIERAARDCDTVVVSIYVNPTQFGPTEDLEGYPRQLDKDIEMASGAGADIIFAPADDELYTAPVFTEIKINELVGLLCGKKRPEHFSGVATIVVKLVNIIKPDIIYFGEKDWQQFVIVKKVFKDLNVDTLVVGMPIVRDADGLALSSRNRYLSQKQRRSAKALPAALELAHDMIKNGERRKDKIISAAKEVIAAEPSLELEYFSICHPENLIEVETIKGEMLLAAAVDAGGARLIDNKVIKI